MRRSTLILINIILIELVFIVYLSGCRVTVDRPEPRPAGYYGGPNSQPATIGTGYNQSGVVH